MQFEVAGQRLGRARGGEEAVHCQTGVGQGFAESCAAPAWIVEVLPAEQPGGGAAAHQ